MSTGHQDGTKTVPMPFQPFALSVSLFAFSLSLFLPFLFSDVYIIAWNSHPVFCLEWFLVCCYERLSTLYSPTSHVLNMDGFEGSWMALDLM